jgi:CheY-like chemotaxis protein/nitrogen-specific signal transduction histidine kinase
MAKRKKRGKRVKRKSKAGSKAQDVRAVEAALAGIAHDIRTPLTGIVALAELLAASDLGAREREWANAIKSGADHLAGLSTLIVDAARSEATGLVLRNEPFSPRGLAEGVGQSLVARAANRNVKAEIDIAADLPPMVSGDLLRLRAALENLADNAVKFTHDGRVTFAAAARPAGRKHVRLVFTVTDSGIGMSAAELKLLFRPFAQASEQIARRYGGAGLGLVFVKRIAKALGGDLKVTSKKGKGSTFKLAVLVERFEARSSTDAALIKPLRPLSILCAEDNPYARVVMKTIVTELGHTIDFAENGEAAVKAAARNSYDAVLIDVTLPVVDGIEATRRIRALPGKAGEVKVIGISGRGDSGTEQAALAAGMNHYFVKPISPSKLSQALDSAGR